ncbi:hypothetical protein LUX03_22830 [Streptomyces sudanensis]|nr:hypothetical protein [Streptomyces sudanensis]MCP9959999.1 hypothetical protein [Streptomyces sudanensis]MCP9999596.1 hypothetical protein [Streptomyces sudanensis]
MGLRPEAFEDAALVDPDLPGARFTATVDVVESLGSDVYAYFTEEGWEAAPSEDLAELAADSGAAEAGGGHQIITRLGTATRVREGERAELYVDTSGMHVFDPRSGANLTLREAAPDGH